MKKKIIIPFIVIIAILAGGAIYINPLLPIITGYAAKNLASGIFVAGRTQESIEQTDLNFSFIKMNKNKVNMEEKSVVSRFLWGKSKAVYKEGFGCTLLKEADEESIGRMPLQNEEVYPANSDTIPWPMGDLIADTLPATLNKNRLEKALNRAFADTVPSKGTFAVAVVYKGQLVAERYKEGFSKSNKFLSWSMAKSFINTMAGILTAQGRLNINVPIKIDAWENDNRKAITVANLMHMNSGLEWNEDYGNNSDVNIMLFKKGDMAQYAIDKPLEARPDSIWYYSSGSTNIVSDYIRQLTGNDEVYYKFPRKELFNKIGMRSAVFEIDASGAFVGSSYLYATMRDYARYGLFYLNNGNWLGEQILPEGWVEFTTTGANGSDGKYGAFFWLNLSKENYPDVPADMFSCQGHDGQFIFIIPSKNLVVVRTGFSKKGEFDQNKFLKEIIAAIE